MQIVAGALSLGLAAFLATAIALPGQFARGDVAVRIAGIPLLTFIAIAMLVVETPIAIIVPHTMMKTGLRTMATGLEQPRTESLLGLAQTVMIVRMSLFEGVGFMACIAYLVEGHAAALVVAGACLAVLISQFPLQGTIRYWLEQTKRRLEEARRD